MGIFSFIKDAGTKVFGAGKTDADLKADVKSDAHEKALESELKSEQAAARKIEDTIRDLQLQVEELTVHIAGDMATIKGSAYDQSTKEKVVLVVGNTHGIASVDDQMSVEHTQPQSQFHTVIKGDSLGKIAKNYYGNAMKYPLIYDANKPMLTDPDKIYPGQVLRIPSLS